MSLNVYARLKRKGKLDEIREAAGKNAMPGFYRAPTPKGIARGSMGSTGSRTFQSRNQSPIEVALMERFK